VVGRMKGKLHAFLAFALESYSQLHVPAAFRLGNRNSVSLHSSMCGTGRGGGLARISFFWSESGARDRQLSLCVPTIGPTCAFALLSAESVDMFPDKMEIAFGPVCGSSCVP
jgi:hypothetical protein